jgi:hypothetical protein
MIDRTAPAVCLAARRRATAVAAAAGVALAAMTPGAAGSTTPVSGAGQAWFERSFVVAADRKCGLFPKELGAALQASALQARGAAARAGEGPEALSQGLARAEGLAASTACDHPDLAVVRDRAVQAYGAWTGLRRMNFPGQRNAWQADRTRRDVAAWRLSQTVAVGKARAVAGLLARPDAADVLAVAVAFPGKSRPYAARLAVRDATRVNLPWLQDGGASPPPEWTRLNLLAASSSAADPVLAGETEGEAALWLFSDAAADALAKLDPRETFVVEFLFRDDSVARVRFEVGDFAAGRAFAALGPL